jgi:hypothetical protein
MDQVVEQNPLVEPENLVLPEKPAKPEEQIKIVRKDQAVPEVRTATDAMKAGYDYAAGKRRSR